jgi:hypothetical protein
VRSRLGFGRRLTDFVKLSLVPYGRKNGRKNRVTIFLNGQLIIVYTCKPHINHKYSMVITTPRIFSSKFGR